MNFETIDDLRNSKAIILDFWKKYAELGEAFSAQDMFIIPILSRTIEINEAFNELTSPDNFNYLGAAPLVRLQIDTLLYTFAGIIANDFIEFLKCFMNGDNWNKIKDKDGHELKESYLVEKFSQIIGQEDFKRIYKEFSSFIHFSNSHIFMTIQRKENGDLKQIIGNYSVPDNEETLLIAMLVLNKLILRIITIHYSAERIEDFRFYKWLKKQYPEKTDAELYYEFGVNDEKLINLFFSQLRQRHDN